MSDALIRIEAATVHREGHPVFRRLNLQIPAGRSTVVLGPNGAGKTTLMMLLGRQLYPQPSPETRVEILGRSRWNIFELRRELGVVSADLQMRYPPRVTGRQVLLSGYHGSFGTYDYQGLGAAELARAEAVAEQLGVTALLDRPYGRLSTGEQRRFLLGRALIHEPQHLLLDEPTAGLDLPAAFDLLEILRDLARRGHAILLITHHPDEILPEIEDAVFLSAGEVFAQGPKRELMRAPKLAELYGRSLRVIEDQGWYRVLPGALSE